MKAFPAASNEKNMPGEGRGAGPIGKDKMQQNWISTFFLGVVAWALYHLLHAVLCRDYYVLQRLYFERLYEYPWRGKDVVAHYHGFADYCAAKAFFDLYENEYMGVVDDGRQEAEHNLYMVPAWSKSAAMAHLKATTVSGGALLHKTPNRDILQRRTYWQNEAKQDAALRDTGQQRE